MATLLSLRDLGPLTKDPAVRALSPDHWKDREFQRFIC